MNSKMFKSALFALAVSAASPAFAHHAAQAQFNVDKTVDMKGTLKKVMWINPHTYLYITVMEKGQPVDYAVEAVGINALRRSGISSKSALPVGSPVTFSVNPARNGKPIGLLMGIEFPDGRRFDFKNVDPSSN
jgi:hypothetical protein